MQVPPSCDGRLRHSSSYKEASFGNLLCSKPGGRIMNSAALSYNYIATECFSAGGSHDDDNDVLLDL
jgi:hypothetical protein